MIDLDALAVIARQAGAEILRVYHGPQVAVTVKDDHSPLTEADRAAHRVIDAGLRALTPDIPVLSEEGRDIAYDERRAWNRFWLVDPLDGTREFINRNGEFTVNIALIDGQTACLGVIYVPAQDLLYAGVLGDGAWRQGPDGQRVTLATRRPEAGAGHIVVASRSHRSPELEQYLETVPVDEAVAVGSSLKFCAVAEGRATLYPRLGPTMEWDTAAGQAIVEAAGGRVVRADAGETPLVYNKPDLRNPSFLVYG